MTFDRKGFCGFNTRFIKCDGNGDYEARKAAVIRDVGVSTVTAR